MQKADQMLAEIKKKHPPLYTSIMARKRIRSHLLQQDKKPNLETQQKTQVSEEEFDLF